jgi:hypothetical protein
MAFGTCLCDTAYFPKHLKTFTVIKPGKQVSDVCIPEGKQLLCSDPTALEENKEVPRLWIPLPHGEADEIPPCGGYMESLHILHEGYNGIDDIISNNDIGIFGTVIEFSVSIF